MTKRNTFLLTSMIFLIQQHIYLYVTNAQPRDKLLPPNYPHHHQDKKILFVVFATPSVRWTVSDSCLARS